MAMGSVRTFAPATCLCVERVLSTSAKTDVLVLGNHGLVIGGEDCRAVADLLFEVERRLAIRPRQAHPADYSALAQIADGTTWNLPDDDEVHALGTDATSRQIISEGLLYPCQATFLNSNTAAPFRPVPDSIEYWESQLYTRPFMIIEGCGVIINKTITPAELAMISGLAQVVRRIGASTPIRYLTEAEVTDCSTIVAYRYRGLANTNHGSGAR
jgi:rhamnose utilization protein RhaD (predicted bifunctional aldolase and dehydrogenase)